MTVTDIQTSLKWIERGFIADDTVDPSDVPRVSREVSLGASLGRVEAVARLHADKVAVTDGRTSLTYAGLLDRSRGLAADIVAGTHPGAVVASLLHNGPAGICAVMATGAAGVTYVPIDAGHPPERQSALFREAFADAVIVEKGVEIDRTVLPPATRTIELDLSLARVLSSFDERPAGNGPRIVMFTSGSTGRPKGLAYDWSQTNALDDYVTRYNFTADDVFVSLASLSQTGIGDVVALMVGATLHIVDMKRLGLGQALRRIEQAGITYLSFVPSVLRTLMAVPGIERALGRLRILSLHGERILASDIKLFREKLPKDCKINITYGSTEAGGVFSWIVRDEAIEGAVAPIGYIVSGKQVALVLEDGSNAAPGAVGELLVRGPTAMGSWQQGKVGLARFLPDPADPTSKIYATGDLVRQRSDQLFEFVGRKDRQVKIKGLWVDLGEVENALRNGDNVADAVAVVRSKPGQADAIVAFVTRMDPGLDIDLPALRRGVIAETAEHMVPSDIRPLESIPRLANYKPDLQALDRLCG
jgi:acyl-coenzyme A synthetase/AMP-(fatty) acid ligase